MAFTWTEVDSATTDTSETDIPFGPIGTATSIQGQVVTNLDNLPSQHPHYSLIPTYVNQAKDELLTLGLALGKEVLDQMERLRNWRWWGQTVAGQAYLPLPERMLYLETAGYTKDMAAYSPATKQLYTISEILAGEPELFGLLSRTSTDYPALYRRAGARIEIWPVPTTSFVTTVVISGTRMDNILSASTDTLLMSPRMQLLVVDLATVIAMEKMGWDEAPDKRVQLESKMARLISPVKKERMNGSRTSVAGMPR